MPETVDEDGDKVDISVDLGAASSFIEYNPDTETFSMIPNVPIPLEPGDYGIRITLTDDNAELGPKSKQYQLNISIPSEEDTD